MNTSSCETLADTTVSVAPRPTAQDLWKRYHRYADTNTENALVEQYLPLVRSAVGRLAMTLPDHVDHDDLHSAGLVGLLQALRNYDPACNTAFESYARVRVRGAMLDELRRMDWVPRTVHEKARRIQVIMAELEQKLGKWTYLIPASTAENMAPKRTDLVKPKIVATNDATTANAPVQAGNQ